MIEGPEKKMSFVQNTVDLLTNPDRKEVHKMLEALDRVMFNVRFLANKRKVRKLYGEMPQQEWVDMKVAHAADTRQSISDSLKPEGEETFLQQQMRGATMVSEIERVYTQLLGDLALESLKLGKKEISEEAFDEKCKSLSATGLKLIFTLTGQNGLGMRPETDALVRGKAIEHFTQGTGFAFVKSAPEVQETSAQ